MGTIHHSPRRSGGLVFDLIEELRAPLADRVVLALVGRGWRPARTSDSVPTLSPRSRHVLVRAVRAHRQRTLRHGRSTIVARDLPRAQAVLYRDVMLGARTTYAAFRFRW